MRIFTRYILREVVGYALLGGVLFTFILFMRYLLALMELAVHGAASFADILRLIGYLLPYFLTLTIPMAVLIGILLGLSRLAADSEITAMRASGMGVLSFVRIVSIVAVLSWAVGLVNSLYVAPRAAAALLQYEAQGASGEAAIQVQPRVFYEDFKNYVLYVQDVVPGSGAAEWKNVFLADLTQPATPHIITSQEALVTGTPGDPQTLRMQLSDGSRHDIAGNNPNQYDISTFASTELPIQTGQQEEDSHISRRDTPIQALSMGELWKFAHGSGDTQPYFIELHRRFSYPAACLVLMLVGVPLGLSSKRGGKGTGFAITLVLVFAYYILSFVGSALARQGKLSAFAGVWGANIIFGVAGVLLLQQMSRGGVALNLLSSAGATLSRLFSKPRRTKSANTEGFGSGARMQQLRRALRIRFPLILDEYVMGSFLRNFGLVLTSLVGLFLIFTFFELIGDIIKYRTPLVTVGEYLLNLIPFILYNVTPLCSLVAVLITFGALSRTSELTAMKATGVSLYRIATPVLLVALALSAILFAFDETYLPAANRKQEALRSVIKGKPAQTFLRADRKWMSGQTLGNKEPTRIFYYQFFDSDKNVFANLTVFEFQPGTFTLTRRIFATSARWDDSVNRWVFENGWQRTFSGDAISSYQPFTLNSFPEIHEQPGYFKKEDRQSQEMSYSELSKYIRDLKQSGFDTTRLRVQLNRKIAYPLMALVMAILAVPFALSTGKRGGLAGMGAGIGVAISYWVIAAIFENLGNVNSLPSILAAWSPDILFAMVGTYLLLRVPT
ncbi:LPS export ABC transporter permease LptG [Granulicella mallensis]|uniref:Permease YjgP/YjgQ family protein n=1 Tax=Granulicella mallensis (strain ATCC BAA-1857 / DSM 23137 / MP5ACTX8) TaxID=682795 RepID=G8NZ00_GRAMM|nr:LPS export ABC transporter permease LptG [Granulicella mallensis]AEU35652.1 permease YjgP/YjgQ family protein [Granulicella mallensis MP5ACTX8]